MEEDEREHKQKCAAKQFSSFKFHDEYLDANLAEEDDSGSSMGRYITALNGNEDEKCNDEGGKASNKEDEDEDGGDGEEHEDSHYSNGDVLVRNLPDEIMVIDMDLLEN